MRKSSTYYSGLPSWAKGVLAVAVVAGIAGVFYVLYKKTKDVKEDKPIKAVTDAANDEIKQYEQEGLKLSFPLSYYASVSNQVFNLLDGAETPLSEYRAAHSVATAVRNKLDWAQLVKSFGKRDVSDAFSFGLSKTTYSLPDLLKEQLDTRLVTPSSFTVGSFKKTYYGGDTWATALSDYLSTKGVSL
jgi:hypothetical protein